MTLGNKLQALRKQKGMSQEQLANQLGVSRQAISKWELDTTLPETENIILLSRMFDVSADYLLRDEITEPKAVKPTSEKIKDFIKDKGHIICYIFSAVSLYFFLGYCLTLYMCVKAMMPPVGFEPVGDISTWYGVYGLVVYYIILSFAGVAVGYIAGKKLEKRKSEKG